MKYSNFLFARQATVYDYLRREKTTDSINPLFVRLEEQIGEAVEKIEAYKAFAASIFKTKG